MHWRMKKYNFRTETAFFLMAVTILASCANKKEEKTSRVDTLPYYSEATFTPTWISPEESVPIDFHQIPPFSLVNQEGDTITEKSIDGKIYVADFFFSTCPGICPKMTKNMGLVQEAFLEEEEVLILSHSVMPDWDSVSVLKAYGEEHDVNSQKWYLLTGDMTQIYSLGREQYFVEEDLGLQKSANDFLHTENFVLIDKQRHIRGIYNGLNKNSVRQLIADIKTLQLEST